MITSTSSDSCVYTHRLISISILFVFCILMVQEAYGDANGRIGRSGAPPGNRDCTSCHTIGAAVPQVSINGPTSVAPSSTNNFTFSVAGGVAATAAAGNAGLNIFASTGSLVATDPNTNLQSGEITHLSPTAFGANGVTYTFDLIAPAIDSIVTIYAAGVSGDGDNSELNDGTTTTSLAITVGAGGGGTTPPPPASPPAPGELTAVISAPAIGDENVDIVFDGGNSTVAGATITAYDWDFGDGTTDTGVSVIHAFPLGDFVVTLLVTDDTGATNTAQHDLTIGVAGTNASDGAALFATNCEECHGAGGVGTAEAPVIVGADAEMIADAIDAVAVMQPLADVLTDDDIDEIAMFLDTAAAAANSVGTNTFTRSLHPPSHRNTSAGRDNVSTDKTTEQAKIRRSAIGYETFLLMFAIVSGFRFFQKRRRLIYQ